MARKEKVFMNGGKRHAKKEKREKTYDLTFSLECQTVCHCLKGVDDAHGKVLVKQSFPIFQTVISISKFPTQSLTTKQEKAKAYA